MRIFESLYCHVSEPCLAALGTFDGVHLGHQKLLNQSRAICKEHNLHFMVFSFTNIPKNQFLTEKIGRIVPLEKKISILKKSGVQTLLHIPFTEDFSRITAKDFIQMLCSSFQVRHICAGFNFRFGFNNSGDALFLKHEASRQNFNVTICPPVKSGDDIVSSTLIRSMIYSGNLNRACQLLGHPYVIYGKVIRGRGEGHKLGFATANLEINRSLLLPPEGVYACQVEIRGFPKLDAVMVLGVVPSFYDDRKVKCEVHILDFNQNLYNRKISVIPVRFLRKEVKVERNQISQLISNDVRNAREIFAKMEGSCENSFSALSGSILQFQ